MKKIQSWIENFSKNIARKLRVMGLLKRLIALVAFLILVPTICINLILYYQYSRKITEETNQKAEQYVSGVSDIVKQKLAWIENIAQDIYSDSKIREKLLLHREAVENGNTEKAQECKSFINDCLYNTIQNEYILNVEILSNYDEFTQIDSNHQAKGGFLIDRDGFFNSEYYKNALESRGITCWYDVKITDDIVASQISKYVYDSNIMLLKSIPWSWFEEPLGMIIINVSTRIFTEDFLPVDNLSEYLFVASSKGGISNLVENGEIILTDQEINDIIHSNGEINKIKKNNEEYRITINEVASTDMYVIQLTNEKKITENVRGIRKTIIVVNAIFIVLGIILSYILVKSINDPLEKLMRVMDKVGNENEIRILYEDNAEDEISYLGNKYNLMLSRIDQLIQQVYKMQIINQDIELRRKEAQLEALQMQINPHFIYNMLEVIRWKSIELSGGDNTLSKIIFAFATNLRRITKETAVLLSLGQELDHVVLYVDVLNLIFEKNINININVDDEIRRCQSINFIMQPLIENAVMHGFSGEEDAKNIIKVSAKKIEDEILVSVEDNGRGIDNDRLLKIQECIKERKKIGKSIGIYNINERLKLMFGESYGLTFEKNVNRGVTVTIRMPYKEWRTENA